MSPATWTPVREGEILDEKYRIERVLGAGGMGVVVAAHHLQLDERVAIKFLLPQAALNDRTVQRFLREARAATKIKSEHVARVTDVGRLDTGAPYIVMEYLDGQDLSTLVKSQGPLGVTDAVDYILQACEALADTHALGMVHRDLKPSNLFLTYRSDQTSCVKILDFGISKVGLEDESKPGADFTRTSDMLGSPMYMSPEQMSSSRSVDARADLWGLGATLYQLIAGRPPFLAETLPLLCSMILRDPPAPLRQFRPDVPAELDAVLAKCLQKERDDRYSNVGEFALALADFGTPTGRASAERAVRVLQAAGMAAPVPAQQGQVAIAPRDQFGSGSYGGEVGVGTGASWAQSTQSAAVSRRSAWMLLIAITGALFLLGIALSAAVGTWFLARDGKARLAAPDASESATGSVPLVASSAPEVPIEPPEPPEASAKPAESVPTPEHAATEPPPPSLPPIGKRPATTSKPTSTGTKPPPADKPPGDGTPDWAKDPGFQ